MKECELLRRVSHPNIVLFVGIVLDSTSRPEPRFLALQYIESGSLHDVLYGERHAVLRAEGDWLPLRTQLVVHVGVFRALAYLAGLRVIHRECAQCLHATRCSTPTDPGGCTTTARAGGG